MNNQNSLIIVIGATAIGKTALSIALAKHYNCEIVSCDSRQFFKEMTVGTAVPTNDELIAATHHFIQNKSIHEKYSVGDFEKEGLNVLDSLFLKNNIQIAVGGSGLYIQALASGLDHFPPIDVGVREQIRADFEQFGLKDLQEKLKNLDPDYYEYIAGFNPQTLQNPQRLMRFIEVCISANQPYSTYLNKNKIARNFTPIYVGLEADRAVMYDRINARVDQMVKNGLVTEVTSLYNYKHLNALQTVGYKEIFNFVDNEYKLPFALEEIKKNTRRFAKRQITWFKRIENALWFNCDTELPLIIEKINYAIKKSASID